MCWCSFLVFIDWVCVLNCLGWFRFLVSFGGRILVFYCFIVFFSVVCLVCVQESLVCRYIGLFLLLFCLNVVIMCCNCVNGWLIVIRLLVQFFIQCVVFCVMVVFSSGRGSVGWLYSCVWCIWKLLLWLICLLFYSCCIILVVLCSVFCCFCLVGYGWLVMCLFRVLLVFSVSQIWFGVSCFSVVVVCVIKVGCWCSIGYVIMFRVNVFCIVSVLVYIQLWFDCFCVVVYGWKWLEYIRVLNFVCLVCSVRFSKVVGGNCLCDVWQLMVIMDFVWGLDMMVIFFQLKWCYGNECFLYWVLMLGYC